MSETWLQEYIFLAFRLHRAVETNYGSPFVEDYWGPEALQKLVEAEPETVPADLVRQAMALADAFPVQGFAPNRVAYLDKHVRAMETLARKLCGETFTLAEEAKRSLDIHPTWTPEAQYFVKHMLLPEDRASSYVASLKHPLHGLHLALTYGNGQKLVRRWLQGPDRVAVFHRFLTGQWTPSQLAGNALPDPV
jgi:hypothetical protein